MSNHHNRGQRDGASGKYKPPHSLTEEFFTWNKKGLERIRDDNGAYRKGHENGRRGR